MATPTNLPSSFSVGQIFTAAQANGLRGAFRVMQVVYASTGTQTASTSATYVNTGLSCAITPQSTSSKILILVDGLGYASSGGTEVGIRLTRDQPSAPTVLQTTALAVYNMGSATAGKYGFIHLDSPNGNTAITYRTQLARPNGTGISYDEVNGSITTMTLMEISA